VDPKSWTVVEDSLGWPGLLKKADGTTAEISSQNPVFTEISGRRIEGKVTLMWDGDGEASLAGDYSKLIGDQEEYLHVGEQEGNLVAFSRYVKDRR
jgi:hypothetical protein